MKSETTQAVWKQRLYKVIFESDTKAGRTFDIVLLICIFASVLIVMLESVQSLQQEIHEILLAAEWFFTIIFTIEYILRMWVVPQRKQYTRSFLGIIDLLSILPTYINFFIPGSQSLMVIRSIRLLRVFRIFKLSRYLGEGYNLMLALKASSYKIIVFMFTVVTSVIITGTLMYIIEGAENGFDSIPKSIYWSVVTMTTVGYGDLTPQTPLGQALATVIMILGYGIIAVPTGIVSAEMIQQKHSSKSDINQCTQCHSVGHDKDAFYCKYCGNKLK
jgi:voltage-gated potassium channel